MRKLDLTGKQLGRLVVIDEATQQGKHIRWNCKCDCGNVTIVMTTNLRTGHTSSCGCLLMEIVTGNKYGKKHGYSNKSNPAYNSWQAMLQRCNNKQAVGYSYYGGRGISVCDQWLNSFETFLADMGERPEGKTLDRIDNNGNYQPSNCRWATKSEQNKNRSFTNIRSENNPNSKLTVDKVKAIRSSNISRAKLALKYGVSISTIQGVQERRLWRYVN